MEKGTIVLTLGSVVLGLSSIWHQLWGLRVDRQNGTAGQDEPQAGAVLVQNPVTACSLLNGHDLLVPCLSDTFHVIPSLSGRGLFTDWATAVASLWNEFDCRACSEMLLSSSSGFSP